MIVDLCSWINMLFFFLEKFMSNDSQQLILFSLLNGFIMCIACTEFPR